MNRILIEEEQYHNHDFQNSLLKKGDYESCEFENCDFTNADLSEINFLECKFRGCNLSLAKLRQTAFKDVEFRNCKLLGLHFEDCNRMMFTPEYQNCSITLCSFNGLKMRKTLFSDSKLEEADFSETDLTESIFRNCDLQRTIFFHTNLEAVDFRSSLNYSIDPENNNIKKARFSIAGIPGLLGKYDIEIE